MSAHQRVVVQHVGRNVAIAPPKVVVEVKPQPLILSWNARVNILGFMKRMLSEHPDGFMTISGTEASDLRIRRTCRFLQHWRLSWTRFAAAEIELRFDPAVIEEILDCTPYELEGVVARWRARREALRPRPGGMVRER